jgi:hypothetical protein
MLDLNRGSAEEWKLARRRMQKTILGRHTAAIGLTVSITNLITQTAPFHVFIVLIALISPSARQRAVRDTSVWVSAAGRTRVPLAVAWSPFGEKGNREELAVDCMVSLLDWTVRFAAPRSAIGLPGSAVMELELSVTAFKEALAVSETIIKKTVVDVGCPSRPSVLLKTTPSSTCRMFNQMDE